MKTIFTCFMRCFKYLNINFSFCSFTVHFYLSEDWGALFGKELSCQNLFVIDDYSNFDSNNTIFKY